MCAYLGPNDIYTLPKKIELFLETYPACAEIAQLEDGHLPIHVICNGPSRDVCLVPFLEANPFSVLTPTPLELAVRLELAWIVSKAKRQYGSPSSEARRGCTAFA